MIASTKFCAALLAAILLLVASPPAQADVILKDHVTDSNLWNGVGGFGQMDFTGGNGADAVGAACFTGNGGTLTSFSGIYYKGAMGTPNGGNWGLMDFRFVFYTSLTDFQNNPFGGTFQHVFLQPSNANWLTPVGLWGQYELFRFDFDLTGLGIQTNNGALHLATVQPLGNGGIQGNGFMSFSTGGGGAIGSDLDWYRNNAMNWGPATFQSLNAPHDFMAARITATVPSPGVFMLLMTAVPVVLRGRRRR